MDYRKRALKLADRLASKDGLDCVAIMSAPNLRYFFGYSGASYERFCCALLSKDGSKSVLVIPRLDQAKAERSAVQNIYSWTDSEGYAGALSKAMNDVGIEGRVIGAELGITMGQMDCFKSTIGTSNFVSISDEISSLRVVKDEEEARAIRSGARILASAFKHMDQFLREGKKESKAGLEIKNFLIEKGAESVDFCSVQSGSNSSIPHSEVTQRKMKRGDIVVVDISCTNTEGYFTDFTRTFVIGEASEKQREIYSIVKKAQSEGCRAAASGSAAKEIDKRSRSVIAKDGYGDYFFTRTGHGLGLEVHEQPWIRGDNDQELERGMVFTVEPGIYLPGRFGVRIEDNLIVGTRNAENITILSHDLEEV